MTHQTHSTIHTLDNGLTICVVPFPEVKTINLRCFIFVGSIYETVQNSGISHFLEHMLFRGNKRLGDGKTLSFKMEELGGEMNAATSFDLTEFWLDYHCDFFELGIRRFCDFLQYPLFEQIEIERSIILEEILVDYNENNQLIDLDSLTAAQIWPKHPMGLSIIGTSESITKITLADLVAWHQKFYQPSNMIIGIAGDFDQANVINIIDKQFKRKSPSRKHSYPHLSSKISLGDQLCLVKDNDNQFNLQWAFPAYSLSPELRVEYELVKRVLDDGNSSRLQRLIREEKGVVYDISADMLYFEKGTILAIQSLVGVSRLEELMEALTQLIRDLIDTGITPKEFDLAKLRFKAALDFHNDTAQGILFSKLWPFLQPGGASFDRVLAIIENISLDKVNNTLIRLLNQSQTCFVLVGPWSQKNRDFLQEKLHDWIKGKNIS